MKKLFSGFLFVLLVCTLVFAGLFCMGEVQATSKPSVPQISSIKSVDSSYDVPPSSTTDQYTGGTITYPGYCVNQMSIEVTIKNQPFTPYTVESDNSGLYGPSGQEFNLYYQVEVKGRFGEDWRSFGDWCTVQSNSGYTVVSSPVEYVAGSQLDFRVTAMIGYKYNTIYGSLAGMYIQGPVWGVSVTERGDWSGVKQFTIPDSLSSPTVTFPPVNSEGNSQLQYSAQTQPSNSIFSNPFFLFGSGALFAGVVITVVLLILRRQPKTLT